MDKKETELHLLNIQRLGLSTNLPSTIGKMRVFFNYKGTIFRKPIINNKRSPYKLIGRQINFKKNTLNLKVDSYEKDTPEYYYFRSPKLLVVNSTFLSPCNQGCLFCEQTQVAKENRRYSLQINPDKLFEKILKNNQLEDFSCLNQISIVTSCAGTEKRAIELLEGYELAAKKQGFQGKFLFATNEIRSEEALDQIKGKNLILAFTIECFSNRNKFMPGTKGRIGLEQIKRVLSRAKEKGIETNYFYIMGLDTLSEMKKGFSRFKDVLTYAPTYSVYYHQSGQKRKVVSLKPLTYYLKARAIYKSAYKGLKEFESCQSFRSLWPLENNPISFIR